MRKTEPDSPRPTVQPLALNVVAGGAGFIGSHLCRALLDRGESVLCLDNLQTARPSNLRALEGQPRFRFLRHDISQPLPAELTRLAPRITRLENGRCEGTLADRRKVRNHIGTVHAIALCNGLEAAMGALAEASIPSGKRWIPKGMDVAYTAKATSDVTCVAETDPQQWTGADPDVPVRVRGVRTDGTVVVEGTIRLWVTPRQG